MEARAEGTDGGIYDPIIPPKRRSPCYVRIANEYEERLSHKKAAEPSV